MEFEFTGEIIFWRGPAPFYFVRVPEEQSEVISEYSSLITYGWGVIPVTAYVGDTDWTTSLFPKDGGYLVPVKVAVRKAEHLELGDTIALRLAIDV